MDPHSLTSDGGSDRDARSGLLREVLGAQAIILDCVTLRQRDDYVVLRLTARLPGPGRLAIPLLVKLAGPHAPLAGAFERTARLHEIVRSQTTVPVAEVLAADASYARWPWRYLVTTILPGREWAAVRPTLDAAALADVHAQLGDAVGQLHAIRLPAFGDVPDDPSTAADTDLADTASPTRPPRPAPLARPPTRLPWPEALAARARAMITHPALLDTFLDVLEARADLLSDVRDARLCHDDLHGHNLLLRYVEGRWRLSGILDFDKAWAGHPETDLARLELWRGMTAPSFWPAYRAHQPIADDYPLRRPLYQLLWCLEYGRRTPAHLADTRRVCHDLGLAHDLTNRLLGLLGGVQSGPP
jgi:fructosamine-3-kinase